METSLIGFQCQKVDYFRLASNFLSWMLKWDLRNWNSILKISLSYEIVEVFIQFSEDINTSTLLWNFYKLKKSIIDKLDDSDNLDMKSKP